MRQKIPLSVGCDGLRLPLVEKGQCSSRGASVDGLPQSVEDKHRLVEQSIHDLVVE
jgi:hypothetical protein